MACSSASRAESASRCRSRRRSARRTRRLGRARCWSSRTASVSTRASSAPRLGEQFHSRRARPQRQEHSATAWVLLSWGSAVARGRAARAAGEAGVTVKVDPAKWPDSTEMAPPCPFTMESTMVRPSPEPGMAWARARWKERKKRVNRSGCSLRWDPQAVVADHERGAAAPALVNAQRTQPPSSVNFSAVAHQVRHQETAGSRTSPRTSSGSSRHLEPHLEPARAEGPAPSADLRGQDHLARGPRPCVRGRRPGLEAREHQQLVGQRRQPVTVATDGLDEARLLVGQALGLVVPAAAREAGDARHRRHSHDSPWPRTRSWPVAPGH